MEQTLRQLLNEAEGHFFQNKTEEGLRCAAELIEQLDLDDDDELKMLHSIVRRGLFQGKCLGILDCLDRIGFDYGTEFPGEGNLAVLCAEANCFDEAVWRGLIERGVDPAQPNRRSGKTYLHVLADRRFQGFMTPPPPPLHMLPEDDPALFTLCDNSGASPLHYAALHDKHELLRGMLERGAAVDALGTASATVSHLMQFDGASPLMVACVMGALEAARVLLEFGADAALRDQLGRNAAFFAVCAPHQTLAAGMKTHYSQETATKQKAEILRLLGAVDAPDQDGNTPLLQLLLPREHVYDKLAPVLLELGADPTRANHRGVTPLMLAAAKSYDTLKALVAAGAPLDVRDANGDTALHYAVREPRTKHARYLIKKGARFDIPGNKGETALDLASQKGLTEVVDLMLA